PAAPTWNFVVVHLVGSVQPLTGLDATLEVVSHTAQVFEDRFGSGWDPKPSWEYFRSIAPGVGAFRFHVRSVESMLKLSQEKSGRVQQHVIEWLDSSPAGTPKDLADVMRTYLNT